jgi:hypothetical protein
VATEDDAVDHFEHHPELSLPRQYEDIKFDIYI